VPAPYNFPRRNRILAALGVGVVVVEAAARSGALITVDHALDLGRDVFAVPGPIHAPTSAGANALIRDGARILLDAEQLLEEMGLESSEGYALLRSGPSFPRESDEQRLWEALSKQPEHVDTLARAAGIELRRALSALATLEVGGWVEQTAGMRFRRRASSGD
jgi:DNA processing protein